MTAHFNRRREKFNRRRLDPRYIYVDQRWPMQQAEAMFRDIAYRSTDYKCMLGYEGVPLYTKANEHKLYIDKSMEMYFINKLNFRQEFINKYFIFIEGDFTNSMRKSAQEYYHKYYKLTRNTKNKFKKKEYLKVVKNIKRLHEQALIYQLQLNMPKMALLFGYNMWIKCKQLELSMPVFNWKIHSLQIMAYNHLKLKHYYKFVKKIHKLINLSGKMKKYESLHPQNDEEIKSLCNKIAVFIYVLYYAEFGDFLLLNHIRLFMKENKLYYHHHKYKFYCKGLYILKFRKDVKLQQYIYDHRSKACSYSKCRLLVITSRNVKRYKCSRCKCTYYCCRSCQKRHWLKHKAFCLTFT